MEKSKKMLVGVISVFILIFFVGVVMDTSTNNTEESLNKNRLSTAEAGTTYSITINCSGVSDNIKIFGMTNIPQGGVQVFELEQGSYSLFSGLVGHFALFEVTSSGVVSYDSLFEGIVLLGEATSILTVIGYPITIDATDVDQKIGLGDWGWPSFLGWTEPGTTRTYNLVVNKLNKYSLWAYFTHKFATFEVLPTGVITYDESQIGIIEGNETNILKAISHPITINATDVDQQVGLGDWGWPSFLGWTEPGTTRTYNLIVNRIDKYSLWAYFTHKFATFEVLPTGVINYDESQIGMIEGNETNTVKTIGHSITIDATDVDQPIGLGSWGWPLSFLGWTEPGTTRTYNLIVNRIDKYDLWTYLSHRFAIFEVLPTGVINYDDSQIGIIEGNETNTVKTIGHPITIDATDVDQPIGMGSWGWPLSFLGWTEPGTTRTYNLVVNGLYKYDLWTYLSHRFAIFEVQPTGVITYDDSQIGIIEGNETNTVKTIGHSITIDATDVDQPIGMGSWGWPLSFLGWTEPGTTRTYNLVVNGLYKYDLWSYYTHRFAIFEVQPTGVITYDDSQIGIIEGNDTNTVKPIGHPITIDATNFNQRVAIGAWYYPESFLGWIEPGDMRTINLVANGIKKYGLWTNATNVLQGEFTVYSGGTCSPNEISTNYGTILINSDNIPPTTDIILSGIMGNNGWYTSDVQVTLTATDEASDIERTEYSYDGINWNEYSSSFLVNGDGTTTIFYRSIDKVGNIELMKSIDIRIDKPHPITQLDLNTYYIDSVGEIFITSSTGFILTGSDQHSGVAITYYRINSGEWIIYSGQFTLTEINGPYTVEYYSTDIAGNEELINSITVNLVNFEILSYLSKGENNPITYFDVIFTKNKQTGEYKLVATNPGQIFYVIEFKNHWPTSIGTLDIELQIPVDFILKGSTPIHIYLDGIEITADCIFNGNLITIQNIPSDSAIRLVIHLDYELKGNSYESLEEFGMIGYTFDIIISGLYGDPLIFGDNLEESSQYSATLTTHQKKTTAIAGYVNDLDGNPIEGATVVLYQNGEPVNSIITDENGFYYFINVAVGMYEVRVTVGLITEIQVATTSKDELEEIDFVFSYENP